MHIHSKIVSFVHFMQLLLIFVAKFSRNSIRNIAEAKQRILVHLRAYDISASQCILEDLNSSQCTQCILVQIRSLRVNSDQSQAYLAHSELCVGWDGWMGWDGYHRSQVLNNDCPTKRSSIVILDIKKSFFEFLKNLIF